MGYINIFFYTFDQICSDGPFPLYIASVNPQIYHVQMDLLFLCLVVGAVQEINAQQN